MTTTHLLSEAGAALYGPRWQSEMARALNVSDRTVRRWAAGEWPVPANVWQELRDILKAHGHAIAAVRRKLPR